MEKYREQQREKTIELINSGHSLFEGAQAGKIFLGAERAFVIKESDKNLYPTIRKEVSEYFRLNNISWWGGRSVTGHTLSSQVACLNHLFAIRNDINAVTAILKSISSDFIGPIAIDSDKFSPAYIQFEAVSDIDHLYESEGKALTRGAQCTSVDALMYAEHKDGTLWLIPIEWKYTESYNDQNKATEGIKANPSGGKGMVRKVRYEKIIRESEQLKMNDQDWYYFEPFYQLMRQTLWAEQMVKNKKSETVKADNFLHLHIIPNANTELLGKKYKCSGIDMETTWRSLLKDQTKYKIIAPETLLMPIKVIREYSDLVEYLNIRYWK